MFIIDSYAYTNKLRDIHPGEKILFSMLTMIIALARDSIGLDILVIVLVGCCTVLLAGIPARFYCKLLLVPFFFIAVSAVTIAFTTADKGSWLLWSVRLGSVFVGLGQEETLRALQVFFKSMAAVSCLYFMSLTSPMVDMISFFRVLRMPELVIELMTLIYKFIFVLMEAAAAIFISQASRLGYRGWKNSMNSMGKLIASLFIKTYTHSGRLYTALASRGYTGSLKVIEKSYVLNRKNIVIILAVDIALILAALYLGGGVKWLNIF